MRLWIGQGWAGVLAPIGARRAAFQEREAVGVEQVAAVGRERGEIVLDAAVDGAEGGQQAGKGVVAAFEHFFAQAVGGLAKLVVQGGDGVVLAVDRVGDGQQVALFGEEEEDQPHHQSERGFVDVLAGEAVEEGAAAFAVGAVERGDEHLHGAAHLAAERDGDFLLVLQAAAVEGVERLLGRAVEEGAGGEEVAESAQGEALVKPQFGAEIGKAGGLAGLGVDQGEALAVGDQAERDARGVKQLRHARGAGGVPGGGGRAPVGLLGRREQADEQARLAVLEQGEVGAQGLVVLGDEVREVLRDGVVFDEPGRRAIRAASEGRRAATRAGRG